MSTTIDAHCTSVNAYDLIVTEIFVNEGDKVSKDQLLMTVDYNKIITEIVAPSDGVVTRIRVALEDEVQVGDPVMDFEPAGSAAGG